MNSILCMAVIFISIYDFGEAVQCYQCTYRAGKSKDTAFNLIADTLENALSQAEGQIKSSHLCMDPFIEEKKLKESDKRSITAPGTCEKCIKTKVAESKSNAVFYMRACIPKQYEKKACQKSLKENENGIEVYQKCCKGAFCNGADRGGSMSLLLIVCLTVFSSFKLWQF